MFKPDDEMLRMEEELKSLLGITPEDIPDASSEWDEESEWDDEEEPKPNFMEELKKGAWNIVRENPGIERQYWIEELISQYPSEVVDVFGNNPFEVYPLLEDMWDCNDYEDPETHDCMSFAEWSDYYYSDPEALRDQLDRAKERIRELETEISRLKGNTDTEQQP
jgi:hypothetical protein